MKLKYLGKTTPVASDKKRRKKIQSVFTWAVFFVLLVTYILIMATIYILVGVDVIHIDSVRVPDWLWILMFSVSSLVIGWILTFFISRFVLNAVNVVAEGMTELSRGNFDVKIDLGKNEESKQVANAFNNLAKELKGIQMLRSNFVNEYAHEFKTPIASIKGFAELLKQDDLTDEQRKEYLDIVIEEANRLTTLSSNSLNLSRIENQKILTDVTRFNLSEQIRHSILLLEGKWQEKNIDLQISLEELDITANEEMLKQVWIKLLDNAVKFSYAGGTINVDLNEDKDIVIFKISNGGESIKEEDYHKIFEKFYRTNGVGADGHGVGLSIVKKIVDLHTGEVAVNSYEGKTIFTVSLPKNN